MVAPAEGSVVSALVELHWHGTYAIFLLWELALAFGDFAAATVFGTGALLRPLWPIAPDQGLMADLANLLHRVLDELRLFRRDWTKVLQAQPFTDSLCVELVEGRNVLLSSCFCSSGRVLNMLRVTRLTLLT